MYILYQRIKKPKQAEDSENGINVKDFLHFARTLLIFLGTCAVMCDEHLRNQTCLFTTLGEKLRPDGVLSVLLEPGI